jgi:asparagine synthase (glutamine-hydrolysing)
MCGIGGILRVWTPQERELALRTPPSQAIPEAWLDVLDESIKHRGPDGQGRFRDRAIRADGCVVDVAFVHRRLSIIDHAGGHQPMLSLGRGQGAVKEKRWSLGAGLGVYERTPSELGGFSVAPENAGGSAAEHVCVVFNGCIYNHRELRAELQRAGHVFSTDHSDTEAIVHGWREWRAALFDRLDGMFAIGLWDAAAATFTMARDSTGEKPLYDTLPSDSNICVFGSTVPTVLSGLIAAGLSQRIDTNPAWLWQRWAQTGWYERPAISIVQEVQPGEHRVLERGSEGQAAVVSIHTGRPRPDRRDRASLTVERLDELLRSAVNSRLEADVPMAVFLSGGIDSALITRYASETAPETPTFTVRMPSVEFDESRTAAETARVLGVRHVTLDCAPSPCADLLRLIPQLGVPFGDSSLLPSCWVSRAARNHVVVALSGDGGDELFGGYERYRAARYLGRWRRALASIPSLPHCGSRGWPSKLARLAAAARGTGYPDLLAIFPTEDWQRLVPGTSSDGFSYDPDPLLTDVASYLPFDLLRKSDTASMSCALELRSPLLSREVVDAALSEPLASLMPRGQRKGLLRQVACKYLPREIVDRPKMGFAIPIGEWLRTDYGGLRTMLLDHLNSAEPFGPPSLGIGLNMKFVRQMLDEHLGTGPSGRVVRDHSQRLYMLLVLSIWAKWVGSLRAG